MSLKVFDMLFFIQILLFSFSIRILLEQLGVNYNLIVNEDTFEVGILTMMIFFIVRCVIVPITEEIVFRFGLFEFFLNKKISKKLTLILVSLIFALVHWYSLYNTFILLTLSFALTFYYYKKGNLIYAILLHLIHNLYSMVSYIPIPNSYYIILGLICFIVFLFTLVVKKKWFKTTSL